MKKYLIYLILLFSLSLISCERDCAYMSEVKVGTKLETTNTLRTIRLVEATQTIKKYRCYKCESTTANLLYITTDTNNIILSVWSLY